jgi:hypothetical protein
MEMIMSLFCFEVLHETESNTRLSFCIHRVPIHLYWSTTVGRVKRWTTDMELHIDAIRC